MTIRPSLRADGRRPLPSPVLVLLVLHTVVGCSAGRDLPDVDQFAAGPCRDTAPAVIALDEQLQQALEEDADLTAVRQSLRDEQARVQEVVAASGTADVPDELGELVTQVGFARAALDTGTLDQEIADDVTSAIDRVVAACVAEA